jgi:predicted porin
MKRSIAIAALSLSSALSVHAQSSVTIYGLLEQSVGKYTGLSSINPTLNLNLLGSPGIWTLKSSTSSRLGFRGTEDLGGGTKAFFLIEHRLAPDTGATQFGQTGFFGGQSFVGLGGTWGDVRLGHMFVPGHVIATLGDPYGLDYNIAGGYGFVKGGSVISYGGNAIDYRTPNLGGLVVEAQVALGEGGAAAGSIQPNRNVGVSLNYTEGKVYIGAAYNDLRTGTANQNRFTIVNGSYDFGVVKPFLAFGVARNTSLEDSKSYLIGLTAPIGSGRLKALYGNLNPAGANNTTKKFGIGYEYFLSKRTSLHADVATATTGSLSRAKGAEGGIKHVF